MNNDYYIQLILAELNGKTLQDKFENLMKLHERAEVVNGFNVSVTDVREIPSSDIIEMLTTSNFFINKEDIKVSLNYRHYNNIKIKDGEIISNT